LRPPRQAFRVGSRRRRAIYAVFALLLLSGVAWLLARWLMDEPEAQAPWLAYSMKLHGAAAWAATFLLGTLWSSHIRHAWVRRRNRLAGGLFAAGVFALIVSGYALYYINGELARGLAEWLHWIVGTALGFLFWIHRRAAARQAPYHHQ
jgi:hypothetical protein